jgi:hypothetical protein
VESDGQISVSSLDRVINNNGIILSKAKDQSVVINDTGITTTCVTDPRNMVRIVDGGIFLSMDSGETWTTGISAAGVNSLALTAGELDVSKITLKDGTNSSFRWDSQGINAFSKIENTNVYLPSKFVRFDHYGIYGMSKSTPESFNPDKAVNGKSGEDRIWDEASFALTWKGFMLKRKGLDGG